MIYDTAIIGTGTAGLSASIYACRYGLKTLVLGELPGGLITTTHWVENYPGLGGISGMDMGDKLLEHANMFEVDIKYEKVSKIEKNSNDFLITTRKESYTAKTIIVATGTEHRHLNAKGEKDLANRGVSYCATCDGAFYKGKVTCIIGGSDSACKEALMLSDICEKVYIIYRGKEIRPEPINKQRVLEKVNIEIITETEVEEFSGDQKLEKIIFKDNKGELKVDGAFIAIGHIAQSELAKSLGAVLNESGEIIIDHESKTNVAGLFAAGDVTDTAFKQAIVSAAEGCYAAKSAYEYLQSLKG
jgi:thioredoxin reductase (NADPH)